MAKKTKENSNSPFIQAWRRLKKNTISMISLFILALIVFVSIFAYSFIPDNTSNADYQMIELRTKPIGYTYEALLKRKNKPKVENTLLGSTSIYEFFLGEDYPYDTYPIEKYRIKDEFVYAKILDQGYEEKINLAEILYPISNKSNKILTEGEYLVFEDVCGEMHREKITALQQRVESEAIVTNTFILGSDLLGRDYFSRLLLGIRVSISVGIISVLISLIVGVSLGAIAGYFRGWVDDLVMYFVNVTWSIPTLLLVFALVLAVGRGFWQIFIAVGLTMWVEVARLVRGQVMSLREKEFIEAGQSLGFHHFRIIFIHIIPNIMGPLIVIATANFAAAVLIEAGLSFLGIGVQSPIPSWGMMLKEHKNYITSVDKSFLAIIPGVAIAVMVYVINLLGNGLRDAFDVRSK